MVCSADRISPLRALTQKLIGCRRHIDTEQRHSFHGFFVIIPSQLFSMFGDVSSSFALRLRHRKLTSRYIWQIGRRGRLNRQRQAKEAGYNGSFRKTVHSGWLADLNELSQN